jgi:hypothetical protein
MSVSQWWWGHRADKPTLLYIVGCEPREVPPMPFKIGEASHVIQSRKRSGYRPHVSKAEREHTPPALAAWLVELARVCRGNAEVSEGGTRDSRIETEAQSRPSLH